MSAHELSQNAMSRNETKKENPLWSLVFNLVIPLLIWSKLSHPDRLGPVYALILGLAFPVFYALWDWIKNSRRNLISALGIASLLSTGILALVQVDLFWFAVKEAAIPLLIAGFTLISVNSKTPIIETFIFNDKLFQVEKIKNNIQVQEKQSDLKKVLVNTNYMIAFSFILSAVINFVLARVILQSPAGTDAFNGELAKMNGLSFIFITIPCMIVLALGLFYLIRSLTKLTGLKTDEILNQNLK